MNTPVLFNIILKKNDEIVGGFNLPFRLSRGSGNYYVSPGTKYSAIVVYEDQTVNTIDSSYSWSTDPASSYGYYSLGSLPGSFTCDSYECYMTYYYEAKS